MQRFTLWLVAAVTTAGAASSTRANGYFADTKGARAAGRAGAFTARADDLSAVQLNPAGLARIDGTMIHVGNRFSHNAHRFKRQATAPGGEDSAPPSADVAFSQVNNQAPWQALDPLIGVASDLGLEDFAFAIAAYAPAGVARERFAVDGGQRYMMVNRDAEIINYTASAAWSPGNNFGIGATLMWIAVPRLEYRMVFDANKFPNRAYPVQSPLDMLATVEGSDLFTLNAIVGAFFRPVRFLEFGAAAQVMPSELRTESTLDIEPLSPSIEDDVSLRRQGRAENDVSLVLPLPITARAGVRYIQHKGDTELFDIELDVAYEAWSAVNRFALETDGLIANFRGEDLLIDTINVQKHWRDTASVQLGGDYALIPEGLTLRAGLFYETAVARPAYANVDFVSGQALGGALGASIFLGSLELSLAYVYRHTPQLSVDEADARVYQVVPGSPCAAPYDDPALCHDDYLGQPSPAVNAGTYSADSSLLSLDALYRF